MMDRAAFYAALRNRKVTMFGSSLSQKQVRGIDGILDAFATHGDGSAKTLAYALATARGEVGSGMVPVREGFASTDAGARKAVNNLAKKRGPGSAVARYAKPDPETGHVYYGRGHVQLTWRDNYAESSADAGVDLVRTPDAMLDPIISARVLIRGLMDGRWNGKRKGVRYYLDRGDIEGARRTVNVQDKADVFADYYRQFLAAIEAAGGVPVQAATPTPGKPASATQKPDAPDTAWMDDLPPELPKAQPEKAAEGNAPLVALIAATLATAGSAIALQWDKFNAWIGSLIQ